MTDENGAFPESIARNMRELEAQFARLLTAPIIKFDRGCRRSLPETQGVYRIYHPDAPAVTIRAGRTKEAAGGLRQRVYQNHLMGDQPVNLRAQLVGDRVCVNLEAAKGYIRESLVVQFLEVQGSKERTWLEHYMLGALQPRYCD